MYTGSGLSQLQLIAFNDDHGGKLQSRLTLTLPATGRVWAAIDGYAGAAGAGTLSWTITDAGQSSPTDPGQPGSDIVSEGPPRTLRVHGATRIQTAVALSQEQFPTGSDSVFLATAFDYPDALTGATGAARYGAPLLLTDAVTLPATTAEELRRLGPVHVFVVGGVAAVGGKVIDQLRASGAQVYRLAGTNRVATAAAVSRAAFPEGHDEVLIANGNSWSDALVAAAAGAARSAPLLLVGDDGLPAETVEELSRLRPRQVTVLTTAGLSAAQEAALSVAAADGVRVVEARSAEQLAVAAAEELHRSSDPDVLVSSNDSPADALVAAALGAPLLLVPPDGHLADDVARILAAPARERVTIIGGQAVVSDRMARRIARAAECCAELSSPDPLANRRS